MKWKLEMRFTVGETTYAKSFGGDNFEEMKLFYSGGSYDDSFTKSINILVRSPFRIIFKLKKIDEEEFFNNRYWQTFGFPKREDATGR